MREQTSFRIAGHFVQGATIKAKLILLVMLTTVTALLVFGAALFLSEVLIDRRALIRSVLVLAEIVGSNSAAALVFNDREAANKTLSALSREPDIIAACIYDEKNRILGF